jgi:hypothetical protein
VDRAVLYHSNQIGDLLVASIELRSATVSGAEVPSLVRFMPGS